MLFLLIAACAFIDDKTLAARLDQDGDGVGYPGDCDTGDADVYPGAIEVCDGIDQNCNGEIDEGLDGQTSYADVDGDGYGDPATEIMGCGTEGRVFNGDDCDDTQAAVHPGADESDCEDPVDYNCDGSAGQDDVDEDGAVACEDCDDDDASRNPQAVEVCDEIDQDCDGTVDEDPIDASTWYADVDGDGFGDASEFEVACTAPDDHVADAGDCDDEDAAISPDATEVCNGVDDDCDDEVDVEAADATSWYEDVDGDGYGSSVSELSCSAPPGYVDVGEDCDDSNEAVSPGATEICDEADIDEDCDGLADDTSATGQSDWYLDGDGDGDGAGSASEACNSPAGYVATNTDCDDADPTVVIGATEVVADGVDQDCDGGDVCYADADEDGFGVTTTVISFDLDCLDAGEASTSSDCADTEPDTFPGAAENESATSCATDVDGDGYGDDSPLSGVSAGTDCDDASAPINPAEAELCDASNTDEDCDGVADDDDGSVSSTGKTRYYADDDGDEYGDETDSGTLYCDDPSTATVEWSTNSTDCDDGSASINVAASEVCDTSNTDEDCDGVADDDDSSVSSTGKTRYYADDDGDEYGDETDSGALYCDDPSTATVEWSTNSTDCDDGNASINVAASEVCDASNADEDCDGVADDDDSSVSSTGKTRYYADDDGDEYGDETDSGTLYCDDPSTATVEWSTNSTDCDDGSASINVAASEVCDTSNTDEDCDGSADDDDSSVSSSGKIRYYADDDGDEYGDESDFGTLYCDDPSTASVEWTTDNSDCDDSTSSTSPGAATTDSTSACMTDDDGDGYGDDAPTSGVTAGTDCDDSDSAVNPGEAEICSDGEDNDCDGFSDENCGAYDGSYETDVDYDVELEGESADDALGRAVASGFDHDGDGVEDLLVCAPFDDDGGTNDGAFYLLEGPVASGSARVSSRDFAKVYNDYSSYEIGERLWGLPDLDGDGYDEIASVNRSSTYLIRLWSGPLNSGIRAATTYDWFTTPGYKLSSAGDYDQSTSDHEVVAGRVSSGAEIRIYETTGSEIASFTQELSVGGDAGRAVAGGPDCDVDGDGQTDILVSDSARDVGASADAGSAYIILGGALGSGALEDADNRIDGASASGGFGFEVRTNDSDGDGAADLWVGEPGNDVAGTDVGAVYLFTDVLVDTSDSDAVLVVLGSADYYDVNLSAVGDVNGDGQSDLLLSSSSTVTGTNKGAAWIVYGPLEGTYSLDTHGSGGYNAVFVGGSVDDECTHEGEGAALGDLDGDGADEILVGCEGNDSGGSSAGALFIFEGG